MTQGAQAGGVRSQEARPAASSTGRPVPPVRRLDVRDSPVRSWSAVGHSARSFARYLPTYGPCWPPPVPSPLSRLIPITRRVSSLASSRSTPRSERACDATPLSSWRRPRNRCSMPTGRGRVAATRAVPSPGSSSSAGLRGRGPVRSSPPRRSRECPRPARARHRVNVRRGKDAGREPLVVAERAEEQVLRAG